MIAKMELMESKMLTLNGLAKGKIESTNVHPLHNANRKHKSQMIALMFAFCQTDVSGWCGLLKCKFLNKI
jgi:hypothetical protein